MSKRLAPLKRYGALTLAYMIGIYGLSSLPALGIRGGNFFHIPLYAGLAFCLLKTLSETLPQQEVPWRLSGLTFLVASACAAFDEWHQAFVPGRTASVRDFVLDLVGIAGMLILCRLLAWQEVEG